MIAIETTTTVLREIAKNWASTDVLRPAMCGIYICNFRGVAAMVATDGHILVIHRVDGEVTDGDSVILSSIDIKTACAGKRQAVYITGNRESLNIQRGDGSAALTVSPLEETYPNIESVLPKTYTRMPTDSIPGLNYEYIGRIASLGKAIDPKGYCAEEWLIGRSMGNNRALVFSNHMDTVGLVMPIMRGEKPDYGQRDGSVTIESVFPKEVAA